MRCNGARILALVGAAWVLAGCATKAPEGPRIESPAGEPSYAVAYPDLVAQDAAQLEAIATRVEEATGKFAEFPEELDDPPWPRVQAIIELADAAGRSRRYVERHDETAAVMQFFVVEDDELKRRVGGAVVYTGKQQGCSDPGVLGGTINRVLEKTIDERLEARLQEGNVAHAAIDRDAPKLGEKNVDTLRTQVDVVTAASFAVYVDAVRVRLALERRIDEAKQVETTLDQAAEDWEGLARDGDLSASEREAAEAQARAAREAKAKLDEAATAAEGATDDLEERIAAMQEQYRERFSALVKALEAKQ